MKDTLNTYIAILLITLAGAGAAWLIVHVAYQNSFTRTVVGNEASYSSLQESILKQ